MKLSRRKDTGHFVVWINGERHSLRRIANLPAEPTSWTDARRIFNEIRVELAARKVSQFKGECRFTVKDFRTEYLEWAEKARCDSSYRADKLALSKLEDVVGPSMRLDRLNLKAMDEIKALPKLKPASKNNYMRHVRAAYNKAVEWGYLKANPFRNTKMMPVDKKPPVYIEASDVPRLLASIKDMDKRRLVTAYIYTGKRRTELVNLEWRHIRMKTEEYYIERSKAHLSRWYPMHPMFKAVLSAILLNNDKVTGRVFNRWSHPSSVSHIVKKALRDFGLGHVRLHDMRHTFATLLQSEGIDLSTIGELLGHTDRRATEIYAHVTPTRAREAIRKIKSGPVDLG